MWMNLENITLSALRILHLVKARHKRFYLIWFYLPEVFKIGKSMGRKVNLWFPGPKVRGERKDIA